ncbi:anti-phage dCTP deaminase [Aurantimonas endophytica]|uniref:Deoxycytidylate deaminase n=1 Tax=Aurantimonas endophytica TaxID=1522175 RepID=A0A7W6HBZ6_9HYPH|nr:anti-phage dCTP deaminase [Aurantimonas endophytica]MBB4002361.1 deoxycytidylate deaminase [Aurantimonas endophytica]MCO6402015.1 deoxycytidylate deaminase [Aurantimonas endophytica]
MKNRVVSIESRPRRVFDGGKQLVSSPNGKDLSRRNISKEVFIAVVGPAGAGASTAANFLTEEFKHHSSGGANYDTRLIKASSLISAWANRDASGSNSRKTADDVVKLQDLGDRMREADTTAVARAIMGQILNYRAEMTGLNIAEVDELPRAFIIDSLRHPDEVKILRRVYGSAFALVGVVCDREERRDRLIENRLYGADRQNPEKLAQIDDIIERDSESDLPHGQHVTSVFELADFYVDNSFPRAKPTDVATVMNEHLQRLVRIMTRSKVERPTIGETAMHQAHSAQKRSACMSRQVGAALVDEQGNVVSVGTNEVPRAGGGVYGEHYDSTDDDRCVYQPAPQCRNNTEQNRIIEGLIHALDDDLKVTVDRNALAARLRKTDVGALLEFSRAVHAEMDAILSAARLGVSPRGKRLYVTTFPCHYCARHIVSAGVDEVHFIEPYAKSRATDLHADSITTSQIGWERPSVSSIKCTEVALDVDPSTSKKRLPGSPRPDTPKTLFQPFVGVAPRMYAKAFSKDVPLKDKVTGAFIGQGASEWGDGFQLSRVHYTAMEAKLANREGEVS